MKKGNLIINVVLVVALAVLYVLHFTGTEKEIKADEKPEKQNTVKTDFGDDIAIAYVNIDTLLNNMLMYADLNENLTGKQQRLENNFASDYRSFEQEIVNFQDKVQKGLLTRREAADIETQLSNRRLELENRRNDYLMELQEENLVSQNKVINYIMEYLEEFNNDGKYRYIFSYSFGGGLLYASDALDITSEVLEGINKKYSEEQTNK